MGHQTMNENLQTKYNICSKYLPKYYFLLSEIDDEGIERDSEDIDDEKFLDTKELDHILEVSY